MRMIYSVRYHNRAMFHKNKYRFTLQEIYELMYYYPGGAFFSPKAVYKKGPQRISQCYLTLKHPIPETTPDRPIKPRGGRREMGRAAARAQWKIRKHPSKTRDNHK